MISKQNLSKISCAACLIVPVMCILVSSAFLALGYPYFSIDKIKDTRPFRFPDLIDIDRSGNIYLAENGWKSITKLDLSGTEIYSLHGGVREGGFYEAWQISADGTGNLYLLNSVRNLDGSFNEREEIRLYSPEGRFVRTIRTFTHTREEAAKSPVFTYGRIISMKYSSPALWYLYRDTESSMSCHRLDPVTGTDETIFTAANDEEVIEFVPIDGGIVVTRKNGSISKITSAGAAHPVMAAGDRLVNPYAVDSPDGKDILVADFGTMAIARISAGRCSIILSEKTLAAGGIVPSRSLLRNVAACADGGFVSVDEMNKRIIGAKRDGTVAFIINRVHHTTLQRIFTAVYCASFLIAIFAFAYLLVLIYRKILHGRLPLLAKMFFLFVVLNAVSVTIIVYVIYRATFAYYEAEYFNRLAIAAQTGAQSIDGDALGRIHSPGDFRGIDYNRLQSQMNQLINSNNDRWNKDLYSVLYKKHEGIFYYTVDLYSYFGTMYPYLSTTPVHVRAYDKGETGHTHYSDVEGDWMIGVAPVRNSKGIITGLYEVGTSLYLKGEMRDLFFKRLSLTATIMTLIQLAVFFIIYYYLLRSLRALRRAAIDIGKGDYNVRVDMPTGDEIQDLAEGINFMTEKIRLDIAELEQKNEELREKDRIKDEFLANTSHELRTPLSGIIGITESFIDGEIGTINEMQRHYLALVLRSARRLSLLVSDILDFSKMRHQDLEIIKIPIDLAHTAEIIVTLMRASIRGKKITITNNIGDIPYVLADHGRIEQIFHNLIDNAVKCTDHGTIDISAKVDDRSVIVSVRDTGIGIPNHRLDAIFRPFEQGDGSLTRHFGGIGLGLPIAKKLVELHGGAMTVSSEPGKGSVFSFSLPLPPEQISRLEMGERKKNVPLVKDNNHDDLDRQSMPADASSGRYTILVVDDDMTSLDSISHMLSARGYRVVPIASSEEARERILAGEHFDAAVIDVMMPRVSGYDLVRIIRRKHLILEMPVILLTAKSRQHDIVEGFESGANDYLVKPFNKREFFTRLDTVLMLRRAVRENLRLASIERELKLAKQIQDTILPSGISGVDRLDIAVAFIPAETVAGDFFDYYARNNHEIGIIISDVTGHGISAALIASMVKTTFYFQKEIIDNPAAIMSNLNHILRGSLKQGYLTAAHIFIDTDTMTLRMARAGHPPVLLLKPSTGTITELRPSGRIIGCFDDIAAETLEIKIETGDLVIIYTDGLIETRNTEGTLFGDDAFKNALISSAGTPVSSIRDTVISQVKKWRGSESFEDDVTLIICRVLPE
jgi:signal transduction histidine kinase/serine phosphatase RsbU (regulator of sigma subunit)